MLLKNFKIIFGIMLPIASRGFYVPGVAVHTFEPKEKVELKVNSVTSTHTQVPIDYYRFPVCRPEKGPKMSSENLGEFLTGNKIETSPFEIQFLEDTYCNILCQTDPLSRNDFRQLDKAIRLDYHHNWIIDNLPSYAIGHKNLEDGEIKHFGGGFPMGALIHEKPNAEEVKRMRDFMKLKAKTDKAKNKFRNIMKDKFIKTYVYNHYRIVLEYHKPDPTKEGARIVGFGVEPMSVKHIFKGDYQRDGNMKKKIPAALSTCDQKKLKGQKHHLALRDISKGGQSVGIGEQIIYTYDVVWKESEVTWASRWDIYLNEGNRLPKQGHWFSVVNSLMVVLFLSLFIGIVMVRTLKKDIAGYNAVLADEELDEEFEETGWKLIHADVFRPPESHPMLFCVCVGSGVQVLLATGFTIFLATFGLLSPARRGSLMTTVLILYMLSGIVGGYVSARIYKSFKGRDWQKCTLFTATLFPGLCFCVFIFFNIYTAFLHSSLSVPFLDVLLVTGMFGGVLIPLVFAGAYFGYKCETIEFPTITSTIARAIPESAFYLNPKISMICAGFIPFSAAFVELFFVMGGMWMGEFYYIFGFLFVVSIITVITCAEITILLSYFQFCVENHRWHWFSLVSGGSVAFYVMAYSIFYFQNLQASSSMRITYLLYFGYMFILSVGFFLSMGAIGFLSVLWFSRKIFGSIKVD